MNKSHRLEIQDMKIDLMIELLIATVGFIQAPHTKNPHKRWNKANKEYQSIIKRHNKKINEYYNNIASVENEIS